MLLLFIDEKIKLLIIMLNRRDKFHEIVVRTIGKKMEDFQFSGNVVMKVVNDFAEKVDLIKNYNYILKQNEDQKQYIFHIFEDHRKTFPGAHKLNTI